MPRTATPRESEERRAAAAANKLEKPEPWNPEVRAVGQTFEGQLRQK